ncbi:MAG: hypothetical protein JNK53_03195 [Phycisphaerae bacterium]|nr:hypothetical protein [Phycisphaerae bacterium]
MNSNAAMTPTSPPTGRSVVRRMKHAGSSIGLSVFGAGLLALAAVEAGMLVQHDAPGARMEETPAATPLASHSPVQDAAPERRGNILSISATSGATGTSLFRLWGSGRIEVSVLGNDNKWTEWGAVAPGMSGTAPKPKSSDED